MTKHDRTPDQGRTQSSEQKSSRSRSTAEWTTLIGSLVVVALLIGAALYEHFAREEVPGTWISIDVATDEAVQRDDLFYIPFTAANRGTKPAEDVTIMFTIERDGETVEESTVTVPFLPNSGSADGELITAFDPATHQIEARPATLLSP
jgi:uncharacterized protein (TIGR02588 family)